MVILQGPSNWLLVLIGGWITGTSWTLAALIQSAGALRHALTFVLMHGGAYPLPTPTQTALAHNLSQQGSDLSNFLAPTEIAAVAGALVAIVGAVGVAAERVILALRARDPVPPAVPPATGSKTDGK